MTERDNNTAISQAKMQLESIQELVARLEQAEENGDNREREEAEQAIHEDPLEIAVRSDWHSPGEKADAPSEYKILLCTGGPAVRIVGDLSCYGEPENAVLQWQNWGTPWTEYGLDSAEEKAVLRYASCFYF